MSRARLVFGLLFIGLGAVLLGDQAGYLDAGSLFRQWWPLLIVAIGAAKLFFPPRNPVGGVIVMAVGAVVLLWTLGVLATLRFVWPLLLVIIGLAIMVRPSRRVTPHIGEGEVTVVFGDRDVRASAGPLAIGDVTAGLGDLYLDLRDSRIATDASMKIVSVFGDVDVEVPPEWRVIVNGPEILGDVKIRTGRDLPQDAPVLRLDVVAVLGDIQVRSAPSPSGAGSS